jgi:hypothetical protein
MSDYQLHGPEVPILRKRPGLTTWTPVRKPIQLRFRNGYWEFEVDGKQHSGYSCLTCALGTASKIQMAVRKREIDRALLEMEAKIWRHEFDTPTDPVQKTDDNPFAFQEVLNQASPNEFPWPGTIIPVDADDPRLPRRNWFHRQLEDIGLTVRMMWEFVKREVL